MDNVDQFSNHQHPENRMKYRSSSVWGSMPSSLMIDAHNLLVWL